MKTTNRASLIAVTAIIVLASVLAGYGLRPTLERPITAPAEPAQPVAFSPAGTPATAVQPLAPGVGLRVVKPLIPGYRYDLVDPVVAEADRIGLPRRLVLALAHQEGGVRGEYDRYIGDLDLDSRGSCGPFQIYIAVHGGQCSDWYEPVRAMRLMAERWLGNYYAAGGFLAWERDPVVFIAYWAPRAQGSIEWTPAIARATLAEADRSLAGWEAETLARRGRTPVSADYHIIADGLDEAARLGTEAAVRAAWQASCLRRTGRGELCTVGP